MRATTPEVMGPVPAEGERPSLKQSFWPQICDFDAILVALANTLPIDIRLLLVVTSGKGLIGVDSSHQLWTRRLPADHRRLTSPEAFPTRPRSPVSVCFGVERQGKQGKFSDSRLVGLWEFASFSEILRVLWPLGMC